MTFIISNTLLRQGRSLVVNQVKVVNPAQTLRMFSSTSSSSTGSSSSAFDKQVTEAKENTIDFKEKATDVKEDVKEKASSMWEQAKDYVTGATSATAAAKQPVTDQIQQPEQPVQAAPGNENDKPGQSSSFKTPDQSGQPHQSN